MNTNRHLKIFALASALAATVWGTVPAIAQDNQKVDTLSIPFSSDGPRSLEAHLLNGGISVTGYDGDEVIVEAVNAEFHRKAEPDVDEDGLRVIRLPSTGLYAEEKDNHVSVGSNNISGRIQLNIKVPFQTSLELHCVNSGDIVVERIEGNIVVENVNGGITASNIAGSMVAHALNRDIIATFDSVAPDAPMSFTSLNGDIDVTLPADTKAELKMESFSGSIKAGFDIELRASQNATPKDERSKNGRYRIEFENAMFGTINGGGPLYTFGTHNGEIRIRKAPAGN